MNRQQKKCLTKTRTPISWQLVLWLCALALLVPVKGWTQVSTGVSSSAAAADAFTFVAVPRGALVRIQVQVQDGYYLYRDSIRVESRTSGVELDEALMPRGEDNDDPLLGQVFRNRTIIDIPLRKAPAVGVPFEIAVVSQGCAEPKACYPPQTRILQVRLGAALSADSGATNSLAGFAAGQIPDQAPNQTPLQENGQGTESRSVFGRLGDIFGNAPAAASGAADEPFLPIDEAFAMRAPRFDGDAVIVAFDLAPGYYLYRERMGAELVSPDGVRVGAAQLPEGKLKSDAYFGEQQVYYQSAQMRVPVQGLDAAATLQLKVQYQGCADAGLCYPPQERVISVRADAVPAGAPPPLSTNATISETDQLALSINNDALALVLGTFFLAGLLLAFTPCVLPMIPILSAIIAGQRDSPHAKSGLALSIVYVLATSVTYTTAGVIAGLFGQNLQALFQHPAVLIGFSAVFVALALAMFGLYELQVPATLQARLTAFSQRQRGGSYLGVGTMGVLSALIVGPCVAAPLAAALIVIGSSGDPLRGGLALFAVSLGMGVPVLVVGAFGTRFLPRAGPWMVLVKQLFGVMMLAVAIYLLSRLLPATTVLALWSALALLGAILIFRSGLGFGTQRTSLTRPRTAARMALSLGVATYAVVLAIGAATGAHDPFRPLASALGTQRSTLQFQRVKSSADLDRVIAQANAEGRIVMLDFYADWCVSCIEMERETFTDPGVQAALRDAVLIQADVTVYDEVDQDLLARFGLPGPPAILFFGRDGREHRAFRVIGFMGANDFESHVIRVARS